MVSWWFSTSLAFTGPRICIYRPPQKIKHGASQRCSDAAPVTILFCSAACNVPRCEVTALRLRAPSDNFSKADADKRNQKHVQFLMEFIYFSKRGEVTPGGRWSDSRWEVKWLSRTLIQRSFSCRIRYNEIVRKYQTTPATTTTTPTRKYRNA